MKQYNIDFNRVGKYNKKDMQNYLCNIEEVIAKENKRTPAKVIVDKTDKLPSYDLKKHKILLPSNINSTQIVKLTTSILHESEHANQKLSPLKTNNEKILLNISMALYEEEGIQYVCNYREMRARLAEAKCILNLYNIALNQVKILSITLAQDFMDTIENTLQFMKPINNRNLRILKKWNKRSIDRNEYDKDYTRNLSQKEILKFLQRKAPKLYKNKLKEIKEVERQLLKIKQELNLQYIVNLSETSSKISKFNKQESARQHDETDKMQTNGIIAYVHSMPKGEFEENTFDYFDDFKEFVEKAIDSGQADKVYVDINWKDEIFKTYIQPQNEKVFADEILEENYVPEITTSHDEIDVSK